MNSLCDRVDTLIGLLGNWEVVFDILGKGEKSTDEDKADLEAVIIAVAINKHIQSATLPTSLQKLTQWKAMQSLAVFPSYKPDWLNWIHES